MNIHVFQRCVHTCCCVNRKKQSKNKVLLLVVASKIWVWHWASPPYSKTLLDSKTLSCSCRKKRVKNNSCVFSAALHKNPSLSLAVYCFPPAPTWLSMYFPSRWPLNALRNRSISPCCSSEKSCLLRKVASLLPNNIAVCCMMLVATSGEEEARLLLEEETDVGIMRGGRKKKTFLL